MNRSYGDITERLGVPLWWDEQCVPRYDPFHPKLLGVYDERACLLVIACQACVKKFQVAQSYARADIELILLEREMPALPTQEIPWSWGDPPIHGCVGDTMSSEEIAVLEAWQKEDFEWVRKPEHEFVILPIQEPVP